MILKKLNTVLSCRLELGSTIRIAFLKLLSQRKINSVVESVHWLQNSWMSLDVKLAAVSDLKDTIENVLSLKK